MKRECKVLAIIFLSFIIIGLIAVPVSASILGDIGNWLGKLFGNKKQINYGSELGTTGVLGNYPSWVEIRMPPYNLKNCDTECGSLGKKCSKTGCIGKTVDGGQYLHYGNFIFNKDCSVTDYGPYFPNNTFPSGYQNEENWCCCIEDSCIPQCSGKQCGDDGCGNATGCGICSGTTPKCNSNGQCVQCLSNSDCPAGYSCSNGQCIGSSIKKLVANYTFEGNANDMSGNGNNGIVYGANLTSGKRGQGYSFNGINNYIQVPDSSTLDLEDELTISMWVYPKAIQNRYASHIINKWSSTNDANYVLYYFEYHSENIPNYVGKINFYANCNNSWIHISDYYQLNLNQWYYVALTYNSSIGGQLYINGIKQGNIYGRGKLKTNNIPLRIGGNNWQDSFNGTIDEVKIWNYALNASEILNDYGTCVPQCIGKQCGSDGCGNPNGCGTCPVGRTCNASGQCIVSTLNATISIATLKNSYSVNEQIKITDPPDEEIYKDKSDYEDGYIIELENTPIAIKEAELKNLAKENEAKINSMDNYNPLKYFYSFLLYREDNIPKDIKKQESLILLQKEKVKEEILKRLNKKSVSSLGDINSVNLVILSDYKKVFNGLALNISKEDAEKIKDIRGIKKIYNNGRVEINMMDSVDIINASGTWQLDRNGNNCLSSGEECLTGKGIKIAVLDTGVDYTHPDLGGCFGVNCKVEGGYDFVNKDNDPIDDHGHGTHVAGIAAGNGKGGLKGIAPDAKIYAYKVMNYMGSGRYIDIFDGIERAIAEKNDVLSMSFGASSGNPDDALSTIVDDAVKAGAIAVVAAGNSGPFYETVNSPGTSRKAITVGASYKKDYTPFYWNCKTPGKTYCGKICEYSGQPLYCDYYGDKNPVKDQITSFSSRGPVRYYYIINKPDIIAPGAVICSSRWDSVYPVGEHPYYYPCLDSKHVQFSGTSMATPIVSGAAAIMKQAKPDWSPDDIKRTLKMTATNLGYTSNIQGAGRIDLSKAVNQRTKPPYADIALTNLRQDLIDINGTAGGDNFRKYSLHYSIDNKNWIKLKEDTSPANGEILRNLDTKNLPYYKPIEFKLIVESSTDSYSVAVSYVKTYEIPLVVQADRSPYHMRINNYRIVYEDQRMDKTPGNHDDISMYDMHTGELRRITNGERFSSPDIYNNIVVYLEYNGNDRNVYMYNIYTNETKKISNGSSNGAPRVYKDRIVWHNLDQGRRFYIYNITSGEKRYILDNNYLSFSEFNLYEKYIVLDHSSTVMVPYGVYLLDLDTNELITIENYDYRFAKVYYPVIDSNYVAYLIEYSNPTVDYINIYNIKTKEKKSFKLPSTTTLSETLSINSGNIVYSRFSKRWYKIFLLNIESMTEFPMSKREEFEYGPKIFNEVVIWKSYLDADDTDIFMTNLTLMGLYNGTNPVCGNGICEIGEDYINCPVDCPAPPRPQSKIVNNENSVLTGNLKMILQKNNSGTWQNITVIIKGVSIPTKGLLKLDSGKDNLGNQIFEGFNNLNIKATSSGDYRVYARFESNNQSKESYYEFKVQ